MSSFMLFGFVRHRARPTNVGMTVGSNRKNANHSIITTGLGGLPLRQPVFAVMNAITVLEVDSSALSSIVAFTGRLACMTRAEAFEVVRSHGGTPSESVTRQTNVLVVGELGWPLL